MPGNKLLLLVFLALPASAARSPGANVPPELLVAPDSTFVRQLREQPAADLLTVRAAREIFLLAGDTGAAAALDRYLYRAALIKLGGGSMTPAATIDQIVSGAHALSPEPSGLVESILAKTLVVRPAPPETHDGSVRVMAAIENQGTTAISQFDARLRIARGAGEAPLEFRCRPSPWFDRMDAGQAHRHECEIRGGPEEVAAIARATLAAAGEPSRWTIVPTRINFIDPPVNFGASGVYNWIDDGRAHARATESLRATGCGMRGSCAEGARAKIRNDPRYVLIPAGLLAGLIMGFLVARFARRPLRWGLAWSLLPVAAIVAALVALMMTATGQAGMGWLLVGYFTLPALGVFLVSFWIAYAIVRARRGAPATPA